MISWRDALLKVAYRVLNNAVVEALMVAFIAIVYIVVKAADRVLHTHIRRRLIDWIHGISRDDLNVFRKAQIRYVFRKKYGLKKIKIGLAGGSYWMSIPCVVEGVDRRTKQPKKFLAKIINDRSALMHRYMTILRNLGVLAERATLAFDGHEGAQDMIEFERNSLMLLKNRRVNVPEVFGTHKLNHDDYVLVMQFIEGRPLSKVELTDEVIGQVFSTLKAMEDTGVFHGDIKLDNFLYSDGRLYVVDCLKIDRRELWRANDFDLICAICALSQQVPVSRVFEQALKYHPEEELQRAGSLLGVAVNKVDLDLPVETIEEIRARLKIRQPVPAR
ncbi:RIO1 family regulatory kinase/ATPase domain-containing protein [Methanocella arvoryzae]|uniref:non-specific serine/threonine protein kinase n=1 Tax=Methanocella arvoryzae (strain DSM 22066 / NBRC 105507 / MRE50) TaxID=351160 RepID=Q0W7D1_METAR|nr:RIO1 family regulatory kinase/ATPase [Methanocella arvoryzae]CAJ35712.1 predicted serine/threonine kinase [Methanocella arvoryzae MRE50]